MSLNVREGFTCSDTEPSKKQLRLCSDNTVEGTDANMDFPFSERLGELAGEARELSGISKLICPLHPRLIHNLLL